MPRFVNEAEEAQWWFDHREELAQDMITVARRNGGLGQGAVARLAKKLQEAKTATNAAESNDSVQVS